MERKELFTTHSKAKGAILIAALALYNDFGYGGVSITEISRKSKYSKQRILYHYKNPDDILLELAKIWSEKGRETTLEYLAAQKSRSNGEKVVGVGLASLKWAQLYPELARLTLTLLQASQKNNPIQKELFGTFEIGIKRIYDFLVKDQIKATKSKTGLLSEAKAIHSMIIGAGVYFISVANLKNYDLYAASLENCIKQIID